MICHGLLSRRSTWWASAESLEMNPLLMQHALTSYRDLLLATDRARKPPISSHSLDALKQANPEQK